MYKYVNCTVDRHSTQCHVVKRDDEYEMAGSPKVSIKGNTWCAPLVANTSLQQAQSKSFHSGQSDPHGSNIQERHSKRKSKVSSEPRELQKRPKVNYWLPSNPFPDARHLHLQKSYMLLWQRFNPMSQRQVLLYLSVLFCHTPTVSYRCLSFFKVDQAFWWAKSYSRHLVWGRSVSKEEGGLPRSKLKSTVFILGFI